MFAAQDPDDALALALERRARIALAELPPRLAGLPRTEVPLLPYNLVGLEALRTLVQTPGEVGEYPVAAPSRTEPPDLPSIADLVDEIAAAGHGLLMVMGKGGSVRPLSPWRSPWSWPGVGFRCTFPPRIRPRTSRRRLQERSRGSG